MITMTTRLVILTALLSLTTQKAMAYNSCLLTNDQTWGWGWPGTTCGDQQPCSFYHCTENGLNYAYSCTYIFNPAAVVNVNSLVHDGSTPQNSFNEINILLDYVTSDEFYNYYPNMNGVPEQNSTYVALRQYMAPNNTINNGKPIDLDPSLVSNGQQRTNKSSTGGITSKPSSAAVNSSFTFPKFTFLPKGSKITTGVQNQLNLFLNQISQCVTSPALGSLTCTGGCENAQVDTSCVEKILPNYTNYGPANNSQNEIWEVIDALYLIQQQAQTTTSSDTSNPSSGLMSNIFRNFTQRYTSQSILWYDIAGDFLSASNAGNNAANYLPTLGFGANVCLASQTGT